MQRKRIIAAVASTFLLAGCGKVLDFRNAEISNNQIYEKGANTGFSGKVTNVPYTSLPVAPIGTLVKLIASVGHDTSVSDLVLANAFAAMGRNGNAGLLCDIKVSDGKVDGKAACHAAGSASTMFELAFADNAVQGHVVVYNPKVEGAKLAEADYADNKFDGNLKLYSPDGKTVVDSASFKQGLTSGVEEIRSVASGKLIKQITWVDGKQQGTEKIWAEDGTLLAELDWADGKQTGFEKRFNPSDNKLLADLKWNAGKATGYIVEGSLTTGYGEYHLKDGVHEGEHRQFVMDYSGTGLHLDRVDNYVNGQVDGKVVNYDSEGKIASTQVYKAGQLISTENASANENVQADATGGSCVDTKVAAFHKESGEDAMVSADMLSEWEGECKAKG